MRRLSYQRGRKPRRKLKQTRGKSLLSEALKYHQSISQWLERGLPATMLLTAQRALMLRHSVLENQDLFIRSRWATSITCSGPGTHTVQFHRRSHRDLYSRKRLPTLPLCLLRRLLQALQNS